jgi:hypothetical protein
MTKTERFGVVVSVTGQAGPASGHHLPSKDSNAFLVLQRPQD